jgi:ribonuclease HI
MDFDEEFNVCQPIALNKLLKKKQTNIINETDNLNKYISDIRLKNIFIDNTKSYVLQYHGVPFINCIILFDQKKPILKLIDQTTIKNPNVAEYFSLISGLYICQHLKISSINCEGINCLIINQLNGDFNVNNEEIKKYYNFAKKIVKNVSGFNIQLVTNNNIQLINEEINLYRKMKFKCLIIDDYYKSLNSTNTSSQIPIYPNANIYIKNPDVVTLAESEHEISYSDLLNTTHQLSDYIVLKQPNEIIKDNITTSDCYIMHIGANISIDVANSKELVSGESATGSIIYEPESNTKYLEKGFYSDNSTLSQITYIGLINGLKQAKKYSISNLLICINSGLIFKQLCEKYKSKYDILVNLNLEAMNLISEFNYVGIILIDANLNAYAKQISANVLNTKKSYAKKYVVN